jgi:glycosyltransferase involved in cell wall biosynthesis
MAHTIIKPMHILIDLQGAQSSGSRHRGIGNYSEALALALARLAQGKHRVSLLLNAAFADTIDPIREAFAGLISPQDVHLWQPLHPCHAHDPGNAWRRSTSEALYRTFVHALRADVLLVTSLFEGYVDDALNAIPDGVDSPLTAVVLYDLIPYIYPKPYLENPSVSAWYHGRLAHARRADLLLAISASSAVEAVNHLGSDSAQVVNISSAIDARFGVIEISEASAAQLRTRYGLNRPFVMYTGGIDHRKNIEGLIAAYAALPEALRVQHQLAVVCSIQNFDRKRLTDLAKSQGLSQDELILTGFVPDDDLLALYNLCALFVFPSWHEGFGLPALEAMACGAPTLASNCSSLPEVVGWDAALFDPLNQDSMVSAIQRGLIDTAFRNALKAHGLRQAKKFSWEATARRALEALESLHARRSIQLARPPLASPTALQPHGRRPLLAYVSPLQPAQSGIADYSAELLPVLAAHYDIEVIVEQTETVTDPWVLGNARQRTVAWFVANAHRYDRILYHFGNSHFHEHMFGLLERCPGVVVLHDFFLSGIQAHRDVTGKHPGAWARELLRAHGWQALAHRFKAEDTAEVVYQWPCNLEVLQRSVGVIVHSDYSRNLAAQWYGSGYADDWTVIPHLRVPVADTRRTAARSALGLREGDILVCSFGLLNQTKQNHRLIEAWLASRLAHDPHCQLVFVGQANGEYRDQLRQQMRSANGQIRITGWADDASYRQYLAAADIAVQLRTMSRGETSGTVLDCMNYGLPTIVNANGSIAELAHDAVWMLDDDFENDALVSALEALLDPAHRVELGARAQSHIHAHHRPRACAAQYSDAIERFYGRAQRGLLGLAKQLSPLGAPPDASDLTRLAERTAELFPPQRPAWRQLFVDISELHQRDAKTGIQRVVRSVLHALLKQPLEGYLVEPVYATAAHGYRYARRFTARFLGLGDVPLDDEPIFAQAGDVFWGLDLQPAVVPQRQDDLAAMRQRGIKVVFTVYDLLPVLLPETFLAGTAETHSRWLRTLASASDGLLSISASVSAELKQWLTLFGPQKGHTVKLGWAHLGADVVSQQAAQPTARPTAEQSQQLAAITRHPAFLMVGTLEPRKAQIQALTAFELLWSRGVQTNLVIVGKQGWLVDELADRLRKHPLRERHVFWLEGIDDVMLERLYVESTCLLAASVDEGYGLPLIEAARHNLPVLARDIPVFREVAGEHATYFTGTTPQALAEAVNRWLEMQRAGRLTPSDGMPWMDWAQATQAMLDVILHDQWQDHWQPVEDEALIARYWGSDPRLSTMVGKHMGTALWSTGRAGYLLYGPYLDLKPGSYRARIHGTVGSLGLQGARADVCIAGGRELLAECALLGAHQADDQLLASLEFTLITPCKGLEVRIEVGAGSDLAVNMIEIRKVAYALEYRPSEIISTKSALNEPPALSETTKHVLAYWATHEALYSAVGYADGRSLYTTGKAGFLVYGPYASVAAGHYKIEADGEVRVTGEAWIDICCGDGKTQLFKQYLTAQRNGNIQRLIETTFILDNFVTDLEIRIHVSANTDMRLDSIVVKEQSGSSPLGVDMGDAAALEHC